MSLRLAVSVNLHSTAVAYGLAVCLSMCMVAAAASARVVAEDSALQLFRTTDVVAIHSAEAIRMNVRVTGLSRTPE